MAGPMPLKVKGLTSVFTLIGLSAIYNIYDCTGTNCAFAATEKVSQMSKWLALGFPPTLAFFFFIALLNYIRFTCIMSSLFIPLHSKVCD